MLFLLKVEWLLAVLLVRDGWVSHAIRGDYESANGSVLLLGCD